MDRLTELRQRFFQEPLGIAFGLSLDALADGTSRLSMTVKEEQTIVGGVAQGGVTTVLADYAGVYAAMTRINAGHTPAKRIEIGLIRPVLLGETVTATAKVVVETRSMLIVAVEVTRADGRQMAYATIEFAKPKT
ncbi:MAG: Thioesterase superfamily [Candidatus Parcubacteria bacterium]|jgi:uncharacterized protein (TIGR00369 family)